MTTYFAMVLTALGVFAIGGFAASIKDLLKH